MESISNKHPELGLQFRGPIRKGNQDLARVGYFNFISIKMKYLFVMFSLEKMLVMLKVLIFLVVEMYLLLQMI